MRHYCVYNVLTHTWYWNFVFLICFDLVWILGVDQILGFGQDLVLVSLEDNTIDKFSLLTLAMFVSLQVNSEAEKRWWHVANRTANPPAINA